jgi:hypothetical protein
MQVICAFDQMAHVLGQKNPIEIRPNPIARVRTGARPGLPDDLAFGARPYGIGGVGADEFCAALDREIAGAPTTCSSS